MSDSAKQKLRDAIQAARESEFVLDPGRFVFDDDGNLRAGRKCYCGRLQFECMPSVQAVRNDAGFIQCLKCGRLWVHGTFNQEIRLNRFWLVAATNEDAALDLDVLSAPERNPVIVCKATTKEENMSNEQDNEQAEPREWTITDHKLEYAGAQVTGIHLLPNGRAVLEYRPTQDVTVSAWDLVDPQWIRNFVVDQGGNMWSGESVGSGGTWPELVARAVELSPERARGEDWIVIDDPGPDAPRKWIARDGRSRKEVVCVYPVESGEIVLVECSNGEGEHECFASDESWLRRHVRDRHGRLWNGEAIPGPGSLESRRNNEATTEARIGLYSMVLSLDYLDGLLAQPSTVARETLEDLIRNAFEAGFDAAMSAKRGKE